MRNTRLADKVYIVNAVSPSTGAIGAMTVNGTAISGVGYSRVMWVLSPGVIVTTGTLTLSITAAASSGSTSYATILTSTPAAISTASATTPVVIDMPVPTAKPWFKPVVTAVTAATGNSLLGIFYRTENYPVVSTSYAQEVIVE